LAGPTEADGLSRHPSPLLLPLAALSFLVVPGAIAATGTHTIWHGSAMSWETREHPSLPAWSQQNGTDAGLFSPPVGRTLAPPATAPGCS